MLYTRKKPDQLNEVCERNIGSDTKHLRGPFQETRPDQKYVNLQYDMLVRWAHWTNDSSTKRLMFQFFHKILQNSLQKPFQFTLLFFWKITEMKIKSFECPKSIRNYEKKKYLEHQTFGQRVVCSIGSANQRIIL